MFFGGFAGAGEATGQGFEGLDAAGYARAGV